MGAGESIESNLWNSTFEMESKNSKVGIIRLTDKQTEDTYICRKISTLDKKQIQQMERLIDIKLSVQSPYVTKLQRAETEKHQEYCAYGNNFFVLFKKPFQTLKQQTLNRKFKASMYSETELQVMLETGVKALSFLRNIGHAHENLSSSSFFVNQNRSIILGDPWMFPRQNTPKLMRNGFIYPSPELIKYQNNEINLYNPHLSDLFTLGLVLLEVFYMANMDCVYEKLFEQVNYEAIWVKLNPIKNQGLKKKLFTLLDPEPKNREMIFKQYLKPISLEVFNQKSKQNFKRNIDRYNLATSEVTEWKNELPAEARLNSSEGQKTFSVSTAENLFHQDKGYNYYEREYGQNQVHAAKQNMAPIKSPQGFSHGLMERELSSHNGNYLMNKADQNQYAPSQNNVFRTGSSEVKFSAINSNHKGSEFSQTYSGCNFANTYQPSFAYVPSYAPSQSLYTNSSNFRINPVPYQTTTASSFSYRPQENVLFSSALSQSVKLPSPPSYTFTSTFNGIKNGPPFTGSSSSIVSNVPTVTSQIVYKPQEPVFNFQKKFSNYFPSEFSQTSIVIQNQPKSIELKPKSIELKPKQIEFKPKQIEFKPKQIEFKPKQIELKSSNAKPQPIHEQAKKDQIIQSPTKVQQKIEKQTPSAKKHKRNPSDYDKFHHLSTINERSEMTESHVSENDDKRSDILIEQDEPNAQSDRQNMSEGQNYHHASDQNKIWSIVYPSGTKYIGQIKDDKRNGLGTFFYIDGSKYHGHWLESKMNGFGTLFYPNGKIAYEGEWKMDNFHGKGKVYNDEIAPSSTPYDYQDCSDIDSHWLEYEGDLFDDRKEGSGILKLVNGQYFEGKFFNDELHGPCKFYTLEGRVIEGVWENSKLVKVLSGQQRTKPQSIQQKQ